tara:strand:+ start:161 stop:541 length:381 start_codon:yes stop_codon:yes gene_type:complete
MKTFGEMLGAMGAHVAHGHRKVAKDLSNSYSSKKEEILAGAGTSEEKKEPLDHLEKKLKKLVEKGQKMSGELEENIRKQLEIAQKITEQTSHEDSGMEPFNAREYAQSILEQVNSKETDETDETDE